MAAIAEEGDTGADPGLGSLASEVGRGFAMTAHVRVAHHHKSETGVMHMHPNISSGMESRPAVGRREGKSAARRLRKRTLAVSIAAAIILPAIIASLAAAAVTVMKWACVVEDVWIGMGAVVGSLGLHIFWRGGRYSVTWGGPRCRRVAWGGAGSQGPAPHARDPWCLVHGWLCHSRQAGECDWVTLTCSSCASLARSTMPGSWASWGGIAGGGRGSSCWAWRWPSHTWRSWRASRT